MPRWPLSLAQVRTNTDDRYFTDPYQAIPSHGYTRIFENMLLSNPLIDIRTGVDFFEVKDVLPARGLLVYTGPIDAYYSSLGMPKLEYRSLRFEQEYHEPEGGYYQEALQARFVEAGPGGGASRADGSPIDRPSLPASPPTSDSRAPSLSR